MSKLKDLINQKFGILTVVGRADNDKKGRAKWHVFCECGNIKTASGTNLLNGHYKSCGCLKKESIYQGKTHLERDREWWKSHKKIINKNRRERYLLDKDYKKKISSRAYNNYHKNPSVKLQYFKRNQKRLQLPKNKLNKNIGTYIGQSIRGNKNGRHWETLVGYTLKQLINHIERQFVPGMTWDNYGRDWEIDHKIPLAVFNFSTAEEIDFKKAWALKNLCPLWRSINRSKGARITVPFQPSLQIDDVMEKLGLQKRMLF